MFHPPLRPVPRLTAGDDRCCTCSCHCAAAGEAGELRQQLHRDGETANPALTGERFRLLYHATRNAEAYVGVLTDDVTEAAVACGTCRDRHCPALATPKRVVFPRVRSTYVDPEPIPQADGTGERSDETGG